MSKDPFFTSQLPNYELKGGTHKRRLRKSKKRLRKSKKRLIKSKKRIRKSKKHSRT
jgi:hypothetical protein